MKEATKPNKPRFATFYSPKPTIPSPTGKPIYQWEYLDEDGKVQTEERNVYEQIQSNRGRTDFKKRIQMNENIEEVNDYDKGLYLDISALGNDPNAIHNYLSALAESLKSDLAKQESGKQTAEASAPNAETPQESGQNHQQNQNEGGNN